MPARVCYSFPVEAGGTTVSRAFVKEPDGDQPGDDGLELPQSRHPNYLTPAGLARLQARQAALAAELTALRAAAGLADKPALAALQRELRYLEARLAKAIPVDPAAQPRERVAFGAEVTVEDEDGGQRPVRIVGEDEADPAAGRISWVSPLAQALLDAEPGDLVTWHRPAGDVELEIFSIRYPDD